MMSETNEEAVAKMMKSEPKIIINGTRLTPGEAMTLRVALGSFIDSKSDDDALGNDGHGRFMTKAYRKNGTKVMNLMVGE